MNIEKVSIGSLHPYENNAKIHTDEQIEQIKKSIEMYGNNDPIAVWGDNNTIVEGHGRWIALKELGATEVEIIRLDHLTDEQRREYTLVHNKLTMNTGYDELMLQCEIEELPFDASMFGFELTLDDEPTELKEVEYHEKISVVIDCDSDQEAEDIFNQLMEEGYSCHISTL